MLIFVDSNILCSNYYMMGPSFEVARKVGTIVLGQIIVDEVCNEFKENLVEQVSKAKSAIQDLNKMLLESSFSLAERDIADECNKYKDLHFVTNNTRDFADQNDRDKNG